MANVSFDGINKIITINTGITEITVKTDLYSDWKEWSLIDDHSKYLQAMRSVGGDPISETKQLGATYFLTNGWRIRPAEWNHRLSVVGNLYTEEGDSPFLSTIGSYNVTVTNEVSTLVESTISQLTQIEYSTFSGGVYIDVLSSTVGTAYPAGTPSDPVNNLSDALSIAVARGFTNLYFIGNFTFTNSVYISNYNLIGEGMQKSTFTFQNGCIVAYCKAYQAKLTGQVLGIVGFEDCHLYNYSSSGLVPSSNTVIATKCLLEGTLSLPSNFTGNIISLDCWSGSVASEPPKLDMNNAESNVIVRNYSGGLILDNYAYSTGKVAINLSSGSIILTSGVTNGSIMLKGVGTLMDYSNGATVDTIGLISKTTVADAVYDEVGNEIQYSIFNDMITLNISGGTSGTTYPIGTPTYPVNNLEDAIIIANQRGFNKIKTLSELTIVSGQNLDEFTIMSDNWLSVTVQSGVSLVNTNFEKVSLYGVMGGFWNVLIDCWVYDINNFCGWMRGGSYVNVELAPYTIESNGLSFFDNTLPMYPDLPSILKMNTDTNVSITNATDSYQINSMTSGSSLDIIFNGGHLILDSTCTGGVIEVEGIGDFEDNSTGTILKTDELINNNSISSYVWDETLSEHLTSGSTGRALSTASSGGVDVQILVDGVWNEPIASHLSNGSFGKTINNINSGITNIEQQIEEHRTETETRIKYILGLEQQNFRIKDQVYNSDNLLLSSTIRLYNTSTDADSDINVLKEYLMSASYDSNGRVISYLVKES